MLDPTLSNSRTSPFVEIDFNRLGTEKKVLSIEERVFLGHVNLRGSVSNQAFMSAVQAVLGAVLPIKNNTFLTSTKHTVLWYGPDEWLILTPEDHAPSLVASLQSALQGVFSSVTDISGGNTVVDISGSSARDLLVKGCPLDLHSSVFNTGDCAQTLLGKTAVTLLQTGEAPSFRLIVRRSFSDYLGHWLLDSATEFVHPIL